MKQVNGFKSTDVNMRKVSSRVSMWERQRMRAERQDGNTESVDLWAFIEGLIGFLSDVAHGGTRLIITVDGKDVAAVVPMSDLRRLPNSREEAENLIRESKTRKGDDSSEAKE